MLSNAGSNLDSVQSLSEKEVSYICFTYITLEENIKKQFNLDKATAFFSLDKETLSYYQSQKFGNHPLFMMTFQCVVCSDENFDMRNDERTNKVKVHWQEDTGIPSTISRYVIKLNISEASAQKLYEEKKFASLAEHIIGKREDKIKESYPLWIQGDLQPVEKKATNETQLKEKAICRLS